MGAVGGAGWGGLLAQIRCSEWQNQFPNLGCMLSRIQLLGTLWAVAHQAPLSLVFSRQEYWSGLPCPPPGDLPNPGIKPASPASPALQADSLPTEPPWDPGSILHPALLRAKAVCKLTWSKTVPGSTELILLICPPSPFSDLVFQAVPCCLLSAGAPQGNLLTPRVVSALPASRVLATAVFFLKCILQGVTSFREKRLPWPKTDVEVP